MLSIKCIGEEFRPSATQASGAQRLDQLPEREWGRHWNNERPALTMPISQSWGFLSPDVAACVWLNIALTIIQALDMQSFQRAQ